MSEKKQVTNQAGLRGVNAGRTAICTCEEPVSFS